MEYTYTKTITIDFKKLIEEEAIDKNSSDSDLEYAVHDFICGFDDCDFYLIDNEDQIVEDLKKYLQNE